MREILFRMYDGVKMVYDGLVIYNGELYEDWRAFEDGIKSDNPLMQWTGLADEYGEKIFEGDILEKYDWVGEVVFSESDCGYIVSPEYPAEFDLFELSETGALVIGNIYDNPELMEDKR